MSAELQREIAQLKEEINALTVQLNQTQKANDELEDEILTLEYRLGGRESTKTEKLTSILISELNNLLRDVKDLMHSYQWKQVETNCSMVKTLVSDLQSEGI